MKKKVIFSATLTLLTSCFGRALWCFEPQKESLGDANYPMLNDFLFIVLALAIASTSFRTGRY